MKWIEEHQAICNKNEDTCEHCYIIGESLWALKEAHYEMDQKKNQPKPEPQPKPKSKWNYKLGRYM
jgi:hypothetical protein